MEETYEAIVPKGIQFADSSKIQAVGWRDLKIGKLHLSDVLFLPQLGGNLLPVARAIDSGYNIQFTSRKCSIMGMRIYVEREQEGNLYDLSNSAYDEDTNLGWVTNKSRPVSLEVWHRRLGHRTLDLAIINHISPRVSQFDLQQWDGTLEEKELSATCAAGRQHKGSATGQWTKGKDHLGVMHSDICGPKQVSTLTGVKYFIIFIDEMSGRIPVTLLQHKDQGLGAFQAYQAWAEKQAGTKIRTLRTDARGEYRGHRFKAYLLTSAIVYGFSSPYTTTLSRLAEHTNKTLMEGARCMLEDSKLKKEFWGFAVATAAHIHNQLPSRLQND